MTTNTKELKRPRQYQNWINNAQGHDFEKAIERACAIYAQRGIARIEKTPEPFRVMSKGKSGGVFQGRFTARAQPDFQGTIEGGRSIVFEAKYTATDRLRRDILTDKQMEALEQHRELGALASVCVGIKGRFFFLPWSAWRDMKSEFGRLYVTAEDIAQWRVKYDGAVRFLEYTSLLSEARDESGKAAGHCTRVKHGDIAERSW